MTGQAKLNRRAATTINILLLMEHARRLHYSLVFSQRSFSASLFLDRAVPQR